VKLVVALGMMLVLVLGIFVGGRLADDDRAAMLLTAVWFAVVLVGGIVLTRRRANLRLPLAVGYAIVAGAATIVLGLPMLGDEEVNERVVVAAPAAPSSAGATDAAPANVEVASGSFQPNAHPGSGTAAVIEIAGGARRLTLTEFETDNGPDLRVYLATGDPAGGGELGDTEDLGALKDNKGNQQYDIPRDLDIDRFSTVVIWCRAFSVGFTSAPLAAS